MQARGAEPSGASGRVPAVARSGAAAADGIVRVATLAGVAPLLRERGIEPAAMLKSLGLAEDTLADADHRIPYRVAGQLLQRCAELTGCPHFGLLVGQRATLPSLGTLGQLMARAPTVGSALRSLRWHLHLQTRGGAPTQREDGEQATLGYAIYLREMVGASQGYDLVMAFECNILRALCGPRWRPIEVAFSHAEALDREPYRRFFRAPLRFNAPGSEIVFDRAWLDHEPPDHDAEAHRLLQRDLSRLLLLAPDDCAEQIRRALPTMLAGSCASEIDAANLLTIPARTLRRRLAAQGTSFRELVDEVRHELARQLLADTAMSMAEIAQTLAYGDASAFTRAFRRWADGPPAAWRASRRAPAGGRR